MFPLTPRGDLVAPLKRSFPWLKRSSPLLTTLTFPSVCPRWCTGNRGSAALPVASRAPCRCPVATGCSARTAPPPQSARCAANRTWSSSSPDLAVGQPASQPAGTTTDSRPVSPDSTDASRWSRQLLQVASPQHEHWSGFIVSRWRLLNSWPVLYNSHEVKALGVKLGFMVFSVLPVEHQYIWLIIAFDQQHCSHEEYFKTYSWLLSNATINHTCYKSYSDMCWSVNLPLWNHFSTVLPIHFDCETVL